MTRKKKGVAAVIKPKQAAATARRSQQDPEQRSPLPESGSPRGSPSPILVPSPAHEDNKTDDSPLYDYGKMVQSVREMWERVGFHANHPNHNPANASEDSLREFLQGHHRFGPILKQYKLYVNPPKMHSLLLQYPNRDLGQEYRARTGQKPLELRIKPKCGLVEVDIPLNIHLNYDKEKGIQYGEALRNSRALQQGGSYGLGGGLGIDLKPKKEDRNASLPEGPSIERMMENVDDANNKGHVMNKITLGGRIVPFKDGDPIYMIATFREDICTWTRLDAMVQLRPQFSHIDAIREKEKHTWKLAAVEDRSADKDKEEEAKAVNTSVKAAEDPDEDLYGGMKDTAKLLKQIRDEPWQRLEWIDQDEEESFQVYDENLIFRDPENAPQLVSEMTEEQYLDAISAPRIDLIKEGKKSIGNLATSIAEPEVDDNEEELNLDDTDDDEVDEEVEDKDALPPGVVRPQDCEEQVTIEMICRAICSKATNNIEAHVKRKLQGKPQYKFFNPRNDNHRYYKWRLAENRAGRGYSPEEDVPKLAPGAK